MISSRGITLRRSKQSSRPERPPVYLLMTRPRAASERFVAQLPERLRSRVQVIYSPLLDIRPMEQAVDTTGVRGLIFTSANGVAAAAAQDVRRDLPAYCVGPATTETARQAGWAARMAGQTAEELVAKLLKERPESPLLHLRGEHSRGNIAKRLTDLGVTVLEQPIYQQRLLPLSPQAQAIAIGTAPVIVPLFSPRTARQFADVWRGTAPLFLAAISQASAESLENLAFAHLRVAKRPTPKKMRKTVKKLAKHALRLEGALGAD